MSYTTVFVLTIYLYNYYNTDSHVCLRVQPCYSLRATARVLPAYACLDYLKYRAMTSSVAGLFCGVYDSSDAPPASGSARHSHRYTPLNQACG